MKIKAKKSFAKLRVKKGLSINQLAKLMEVNQSVVSKMERGLTIRPATARKACIALNESFETLFVIEEK